MHLRVSSTQYENWVIVANLTICTNNGAAHCTNIPDKPRADAGLLPLAHHDIVWILEAKPSFILSFSSISTFTSGVRITCGSGLAKQLPIRKLVGVGRDQCWVVEAPRWLTRVALIVGALAAEKNTNADGPSLHLQLELLF